MSITLFWSPQTRATRGVWLLEELGVAYERVAIDLRDAESRKHPGFQRASPMGKVPAILDGEVAMAESAAIALYLADRYSSGQLAPALDDPQRGMFLYWMFFTPAVIEPAISEKVSGGKPNPHTNGWGDYDSMLRVLREGLEAGPTGPWILGETFTVADVMVGGSLIFMRMFGMLPDIPALSAYADRCAERPAYQASQRVEPPRS